ncbi:hypothetical protein TcYC6_0013880 [Trypanosoma cruzi]|nr:hypothetical protein TcYC6_0013880 [Trypanosoma cruzi]
MSFLPDRDHGEEEICDSEHTAPPPQEQRQLPPVAAVSSVPLQPRVSHEEPLNRHVWTLRRRFLVLAVLATVAATSGSQAADF